MQKEFPHFTGRFMRLKEIIAPAGPIPIAKSTLWAKVKSGHFPQPIKLFDRVTCWRVEDVQAFLDKANDPSASDGVAMAKSGNFSASDAA